MRLLPLPSTNRHGLLVLYLFKSPQSGVTLRSAQSRCWSRHKAGFGTVGLGSAQSRFWSRHKACFGAFGLGSAQSRLWSRHKAGSGAAGYKTGLVSRQVLHLLSKLQNWICPKTGQYKTCIVSNNKIDCVYIYIFSLYIDIWIHIHTYIYINIYIYIYNQS